MTEPRTSIGSASVEETNEPNGPRAFRTYLTGKGKPRITFCMANGRERTLAYFHLVEMDYNPDAACLELSFVGHRVIVQGRNIKALYRQMTVENVKEITERHSSDMLLDETDCYIEAIKIETI